LTVNLENYRLSFPLILVEVPPSANARARVFPDRAALLSHARSRGGNDLNGKPERNDLDLLEAVTADLTAYDLVQSAEEAREELLRLEQRAIPSCVQQAARARELRREAERLGWITKTID